MTALDHKCFHCGKRGAVPGELLWSFTLPSKPECAEHRGALAALEVARTETAPLPFDCAAA